MTSKLLESHVKIIAKPNTWFKAGTEVLVAYGPEPYKRITFQQLYDLMAEDVVITGAVFCGTRINHLDCEDNGYIIRSIGDERKDEELCAWDEFTFELVDPSEGEA